MNDWNKRFGAKRRATDRVLIAECERRLSFVCGDCGAESFNVNDVVNNYCGRCRAFKAPRKPKDGDSRDPAPKLPPKPETPASDARLAIARAFGRPLH